VLADGIPLSELLFQIETICTNKAIKVLISPNLYDLFTGRTKTQNLYGIPLIEVTSRLIKPYQAIIKRVFDIVFSLFVIIVGMPF
jgi:lipopolysaccharide/colanic/teichoic acid biosynthesis glycosyltransferase